MKKSIILEQSWFRSTLVKLPSQYISDSWTFDPHLRTRLNVLSLSEVLLQVYFMADMYFLR